MASSMTGGSRSEGPEDDDKSRSSAGSEDDIKSTSEGPDASLRMFVAVAAVARSRVRRRAVVCILKLLD